MIDNFELVKQLISFNEEDKLFFFLQIVRRAKDHRYNNTKVKEGAIINESCKYHIALSTDGEILVNKDENHYWETISGARPATREQCNLLFEKMAKKGYRWNTSNNKIVKL